MSVVNNSAMWFVVIALKFNALIIDTCTAAGKLSLLSKGQQISTAIFQEFLKNNYPERSSQDILFSIFGSFLEELRVPKIAFKIYWPLISFLKKRQLFWLFMSALFYVTFSKFHGRRSFPLEKSKKIPHCAH